MENALDRQEAVAEVCLGRRTHADAGTGLPEQVELTAVGMGGVNDRGARPEAAALGEELGPVDPWRRPIDVVVR